LPGGKDKTGNRLSAGSLTMQHNEDCPASGGPSTPLPPTTQWRAETYGYTPGTHRLFTKRHQKSRNV
jgi:hypothetical protein